MISKSFILKKIKQGLIHFVFWVGILYFYFYFFQSNESSTNDSFWFALSLMPITIATTYVVIYKLIPVYLIPKRYLRFALYSIYTLIISTYLLFVSIFFSLIYLSHFEYGEMNPLTKNILVIMTVVYLVVVVVSAFKLLTLNFRQNTKAKDLERKILETQLKLKEQELNYLKMQIHPHFLFNTLNTIYGLAIKKADQAPEIILKLSNLLDYLLYQANKPTVSILEEIEHIKDYLALERMRFNDSLEVNLDIKIESDLNIAPMLLLPFIENSFKHGDLSNGRLIVDLKLHCDDNDLTFELSNSCDHEGNSNPGIGLNNIKKRLDILYPKRYDLDLIKLENAFKVTLNIENIGIQQA